MFLVESDRARIVLIYLELQRVRCALLGFGDQCACCAAAPVMRTGRKLIDVTAAEIQREEPNHLASGVECANDIHAVPAHRRKMIEKPTSTRLEIDRRHRGFPGRDPQIDQFR